jgi:multiple sugar transport system substrate-binding protein
MTKPTRRSVIRGSLGLVAAGAIARPYIANAAAKTATVWWGQGFAQEEDIAIKKIVADYEKASGNTIELSIAPFAPLRQKIVAAMQSGVLPDLFPNTPAEITGLHAWEDRLVDVTDVVETQKSKYTETALLNTYCYNSATKRRSFYGVPWSQAVFTNHVWRSLVEKAGYSLEDLPKTWDAYYDFFKGVQKKLRAKGCATSTASVFRSPLTVMIPTSSSIISCLPMAGRASSQRTASRTSTIRRSKRRSSRR